MKNLLTISDLVDELGGTLCPKKLHLKLKEDCASKMPPITFIESLPEITPDIQGTLLHAYIANELKFPHTKHKYKYPAILKTAREYIKWANKKDYIITSEIEKTITIELIDDYLPNAKLVGRPDLYSCTEEKLVVVDWKLPNTIITPDYWQQIKLYAVLIMAYYENFTDAELIIYNGKENIMLLKSTEAKNIYNKLLNICTSAVANIPPSKPVSDCSDCKCMCDSIESFTWDYMRRWSSKPVRAAKYYPVFKHMVACLETDIKKAIDSDGVPGAKCKIIKKFKSTQEAVEEYEKACKKAGIEDKLPKIVKRECFEAICGEKAAEKFKTVSEKKYYYGFDF